MISVFKCGYDSKHPTNFEMHRPHGSPDYSLLLVKTVAYFYVDGIPVDTQPNTVILYNKTAAVRYGCRRKNYNDDWIHFDMTEDEHPFFESLSIPCNVHCRLSCLGLLSDYARLVVLEQNGSHIHKEQILDSLMRSLLYSLSSQLQTVPDRKTAHKYYAVLNKLRMSILNAPHKKWTVPEMAQTVHMSPSYFQHLYKELFGISCMQDVIAARLKNARFYLRTSDMSIQSLAEFCGYENELHFMRQFKKQEGMTPSQYRELFRSW